MSINDPIFASGGPAKFPETYRKIRTATADITVELIDRFGTHV